MLAANQWIKLHTKLNFQQVFRILNTFFSSPAQWQTAPKRHNVADTRNLERRDWNSELRPRRHDKNFCPFLSGIPFGCCCTPVSLFFWCWALAALVSCLSHANLNLTHVCWQTIRHLTPPRQPGWVWLIKMRGIGSVPSTKVKTKRTLDVTARVKGAKGPGLTCRSASLNVSQTNLI